MVIWVSLALGVAGAVMGGISSYQAGQAQKRQSEYQAKVANQQAILAQREAEENSRLTQSKAMSDTKQLQRKYAIAVGAAKAARAASGLGGGGVSEGDIATDTFKTQTADEIMIRYNADVKSWDLNRSAEMEVWGLGNQAEMYRMRGKDAAAAGNMGAVSSVLSNAGSTGLQGYTAYKAGK